VIGDATSRAGRHRRPAAAALLTCAALLGACGGGDDGAKAVDRPFRPASTTTAAAAQPAPGSVKTDDGTTRRATLADARAAVDADHYAVVERTLPALTAAERRTVRERVANRLARKAGAALQNGNGARVASMLAQAKDYPETNLVREVREDYEAAVKEAAKSRSERLLARQREHRERRQRARAERAAALARKTQEAKQR
jgi:hypothetical protein